MYYRVIFLLVCMTILTGCYDEQDFSPSAVNDVLKLQLRNNNTLADSESQIEVRALFPADFQTEEDDKVDFIIQRNSGIEEVTSEILFVQENGVDKRLATTKISSIDAESFVVNAKISVNGATIQKDTTITFLKAYPENIRQSVSTPLVKPNFFETITITTTLERNKGKVSKNTIVDVIVVDTAGVKRGRIDDLITKSNEEGVVENKFAMGEDTYVGKLYLISSSETENQTVLRDTITLISKMDE